MDKNKNRNDRTAGGRPDYQNEKGFRYLRELPEEISDGKAQEAAGIYSAGHGLKNGKKQGEYTLEDYLALPEEERWELIDGYLIRMDSPTTEHQIILGNLYTAFRKCIEDHDAPCKVLFAPADVQLEPGGRDSVPIHSFERYAVEKQQISEGGGKRVLDSRPGEKKGSCEPF